VVVGFTYIMTSLDSSCHVVVFESSAEYPSATELRSGLEKGSDEVKIDTLRKIIVSTINGNPQVSGILFFIII
jgi:coatomer subunit beta